MRFGVLGPLAVWTDDGRSVSIPGAKVRAFLARLLVDAGEPVSADRLLTDLWNPVPPAGGHAAVQTAVSRLRRVLEAAEPGARALVESGPSGYRLGAAAEAVDAGRFDALLAAAREADAPRDTAALLGEALALWRGPALADHADAPFAAAAVARCEEQRAVALEERVAARLAQGEDATLLAELDELVRRYPLRERLRATQMRALYRAGRQAEALEVFRRVRAVLAEEIGADPAPELVRLHQSILEQSPELAAPSAEERRPDPPPGNLPAVLTDVIGRDAAVGEVRAHLNQGRLVTLTGAGGVGKTTLALTAAEPDAARYPDGTWLVELLGRGDRSDDADDVADFIATMLGLRDDMAVQSSADQTRLSAADLLARTLRGRRLLLVLDNCEHAAHPVGQLLATLLRAAPGLRVLATSREPLGVPGERLYPVSPLESPAGSTLAEVERSAAAQLFAKRAAALVPGFTVDAATAPAVAEICCRLDGLPLALELGAARLRVLNVRELAERLDDRFQLLTSGGNGYPARQQTLRAVIDWSWEPLAEVERAVLRRLSVHAGGFTLPGAEAVAAGDGIDPENVLDILAQLVDRSLVVAETTPLGTRYRMLESVTAYARERLAQAGEEAARERHARYWVGFAEESDRLLRGPEQLAALQRLDTEGANLRAALEWAVDHGEADLALRLTGALGWHWYLRGRRSKGRRLLDAALSVPGPCSSTARARALVWRAVLGQEIDSTDRAVIGSAREALSLYERSKEPAGLAEAQALLALLVKEAKGWSGQLPSAAALAESAHDAFRRLGDPWGMAAALLARGWEELRRSDLAAAWKDADESYALFRALGDRWGQVRGAHLLGVLAEIAGDYAEAVRLHRSGLECSEEVGLESAAAEELARLGRLSILSRDFAAADAYHEEVLRRTRGGSFTAMMSFAREGLGMSARRQGKLDRAESYLRENLAVHTAEEFHPGRASILAELGFIAEMRGDAEAARALHLDGLAASRAAGDPRATAQALEGIAGAAVLDGEPERAARLLGAAAAARQAAGAPQPSAERFDVDRITAAARAALGTDRFAAAFRSGERTPLAEAANRALHGTRPTAARI